MESTEFWVSKMVLGLSSSTASCLAEQTALSDLLLDCTMTRTIDAVFHIVFVCVCYVFVLEIEICNRLVTKIVILCKCIRMGGDGDSNHKNGVGMGTVSVGTGIGIGIKFLKMWVWGGDGNSNYGDGDAVLCNSCAAAMTDVPATKLDFPASVSASTKVHRLRNKNLSGSIHC